MVDQLRATDSMVPDRLIASPQGLIAEEGYIAAGQGALVRGQVMAQITKAAIAGAPGGQNVGDADFAAVPTRGAGAKVGDYLITVIELAGAKVKGSATKVAGSTGDGVITFTSITQDAKAGTYVARCIEEVLNGGVFELLDPDGFNVGTIIVGTAFDNGVLQITVADGNNDWDLEDLIEFEVDWDTDLSVFSVIDPDGIRQADGAIGSAYAGDIEFTLEEADVPTHSALGDTWLVTVADGAVDAHGRHLWGPALSTAVDGRAEACGILAEAEANGDSSVVTSIYTAGEFDVNSLTFAGVDTIANHRESLRAHGIVLRSSVLHS